MSKKQYILMILDALENDRPLAKDLKRFVLLDKFDNEALTQLTQILKQTVQTVQTQEAREKMEKSIQILEKIQEAEGDSLIQDQAELKELENSLRNI